ncbi:hypothetical protein [Haloplanus pelagicus]|jgi:hypothetical protein|uniref:hypothetical protein n=1 Tax=Haloplanus pelagicus TaxID=2949995 RepID=UPI00203D13CF|nr:hypothetical protein [Haloplanus sp. HW8-1]
MTVDDEDLRTLHEHLVATEELPVRPDASPWLGEATAITADLVDADLPASVVVGRIERVADLLDEVETTGNPAADDHVTAAGRAACRILDADDG